MRIHKCDTIDKKKKLVWFQFYTVNFYFKLLSRVTFHHKISKLTWFCQKKALDFIGTLIWSEIEQIDLHGANSCLTTIMNEFSTWNFRNWNFLSCKDSAFVGTNIWQGVQKITRSHLKFSQQLKVQKYDSSTNFVGEF